jgi:uncharacterized LabA/DUF88 family protein
VTLTASNTHPTHDDGATDSTRIAIFIDGSNLYHALEQSCGRTDLDFAAFIQWVAGGRPLFRTYYYNIIQDEKRRPTDHRDQQRFLQALYQIPYLETRFGSVRYRDGQMVEKGVDIMLATDLLYYAWQDFYDMAVLVSGDGDFAYALQTVKNIGKYVQVVCFESNQSPELWQTADERTLLTNDLLRAENLWMTKEEGGAGKARRRRRRPSGARRGPAGANGQPATNGAMDYSAPVTFGE